jgi:peroxiredoxin
MVETRSTMHSLGTQAHPFRLTDVRTGKPVSLDDFRASKALLVAFLCNHCPFVKHVQSGLVSLARDAAKRGVAVVGISSNDVNDYPQDGPTAMAEEAKRAGYDFPYLFDETQEVAKAYRAACTPDFFLFDAKRRLVYRGRMDDARPGNDLPVTGAELRAAIDALLASKPISADQKSSVGCNIKWKRGSEPDYFPA